VAQSLPVLVTIFNARLKLLELYLDEKTSWVSETQRVCADLRAQIALIPTDSFSVKRVYPEIEQAWGDSFWRYLTQDRLEFLKLKVGPLLRYAPGVDVQAAT
jgi:type I restriction enzyme R subunit